MKPLSLCQRSTRPKNPKSGHPFQCRFLTAALPTLAALAVSATLGGCAWIDAHRSELRDTALVLGKRVAIVAGKVALDAVIRSRQPDATMGWQEYAAASIHARKWELISSADIQWIADTWRSESSTLAPAADTFTRLWDRFNPRTQAEVDAFLRAYAAALQSPRAALAIEGPSKADGKTIREAR